MSKDTPQTISVQPNTEYIDSLVTNKQNVLTQSVRHLRVVMLITAVCLFSYCGRTSVWLQYVDAVVQNDEKIAFVIWLEFMLLAVVGFIACIYGDKYGQDRVMAVLLFFVLIGCIIQSIASSCMVVSVGYLLAQLSFVMIFVSFSYIAYLLPFTLSVQYLAYNYAAIIIAALLGPVSTFSVTYFLASYKLCLNINIGIALVLLLLCLLFVFDKFASMRDIQLQAERCLHEMNAFKVSHGDHDTCTATYSGDIFPIFLQQQSGKEGIQTDPKLNILPLSRYTERYLLFHAITQIGFICGAFSVFYLFYMQHLQQKFERDATAWMSYLHLFASGVAAALGMVTSQPILANATFVLKRSGVCFVLCAQFAMYMFGFVHTHSVHFYLVWCGIAHFMSGLLLVDYERLLLGLLSNSKHIKRCGAINGIKCVVCCIMRAICISCPAVLEDRTINAMWYTLAGIAVVMCVLEIFYGVLVSALRQQHANEQ